MLERPLVRGVIAGALLVVVGIGLVAAGQLRSDGDKSVLIAVQGAPTTDATAEREEGIGALDDRRPLVGKPAPDFALRTREGSVTRLSDLRGKVVLVNFWATWCRPCAKELPLMQRIFEEKGGDSFEVLAVNYQESASRAGDYWSERGFTMGMVLDRRGDVYEQYRLLGLPNSFFVDREGNIAAFQYGEINEERLRKKLAEAGLP